MRLLLISPEFFNYSQIISDAFKRRGFSVRWYSDRNKTSVFGKAILRIKKSFAGKSIKKYLDKILGETSSETFDYVVVINGEVLTPEFISQLRSAQPAAKFILYMWDALANFKDSQKIAPLFDARFSFDKSDCDRDPSFAFLPLFYYDKGLKEKFASTEKVYDYACITTVKAGKMQHLKEIFSQLDSHFSSSYKYLYLQGRFVYLYYKLKYRKEFSGMKMKDFRYKRIPYDKYSEIVCKSRILVDIPMKNQNGLTIRTFECLGSGQKLITSNKNIAEYDFYSPEYIYIFGDGDINTGDAFFNDGAVSVKNIENYYIDRWVERILGKDVQ